jgi:hypothetical protein
MWNHVAMGAERTPYYRADLALIHHEGFAFHAEDCAPGILSLLESVRSRHGLVVEQRADRHRLGARAAVPPRRARADVGQAFGSELLPEGLRTLIGRREA